MRFYDYNEWREWPEGDVREYARELAQYLSLPSRQADHLEREMLQRAGIWPRPQPRFGPFKMGEELEASFRSLGNDDQEVFNQNKRMNGPAHDRHTSNDDWDVRWETIGSGLSRRRVRQIVREPARVRKWRKEDRRAQARHPFAVMQGQIKMIAEDARWAANSLKIDHDTWMDKSGNDRPHEGYVWFAEQLSQAYGNARAQASLGNAEAAAYHAFRAGALFSELEMVLVHGARYEKYEAVQTAQRDAANARKRIPDEVRRATWWRYRELGHKRADAGRLAGEELGLSEASIRNAFPDYRYPA